MLIKQIMEVFDVLDSSTVTGKSVEEYLRSIKADANIEVYALKGPKGESTDMVKVRIPGTKRKDVRRRSAHHRPSGTSRRYRRASGDDWLRIRR